MSGFKKWLDEHEDSIKCGECGVRAYLVEQADLYAEQKIQRLKKALQEIRGKQGRVCQDFELCDHVACTSSYASWMIADKALKEE